MERKQHLPLKILNMQTSRNARTSYPWCLGIPALSVLALGNVRSLFPPPLLGIEIAISRGFGFAYCLPPYLLSYHLHTCFICTYLSFEADDVVFDLFFPHQCLPTLEKRLQWRIKWGLCPPMAFQSTFQAQARVMAPDLRQSGTCMLHRMLPNRTSSLTLSLPNKGPPQPTKVQSDTTSANNQVLKRSRKHYMHAQNIPIARMRVVQYIGSIST